MGRDSGTGLIFSHAAGSSELLISSSDIYVSAFVCLFRTWYTTRSISAMAAAKAGGRPLARARSCNRPTSSLRIFSGAWRKRLSSPWMIGPASPSRAAGAMMISSQASATIAAPLSASFGTKATVWAQSTSRKRSAIFKLASRNPPGLSISMMTRSARRSFAVSSLRRRYRSLRGEMGPSSRMSTAPIEFAALLGVLCTRAHGGDEVEHERKRCTQGGGEASRTPNRPLGSTHGSSSGNDTPRALQVTDREVRPTVPISLREMLHGRGSDCLLALPRSVRSIRSYVTHPIAGPAAMRHSIGIVRPPSRTGQSCHC